MKNNLILLASITISLILPSKALAITGWGSSSFTLDADFSAVGSSISTSTTFSFTGDGSSNVAGTFTPSASVSSSIPTLYLDATVTSYTPPSPTFFIDLYDADFDYITYQGSFSGFTPSVPQIFPLSYLSTTLSGGGTFSNSVNALNLRLGSSGGSVSILFDNLTTAIPEPSTYAGLAGLAILGFAAMRRRRA